MKLLFKRFIEFIAFLEYGRDNNPYVALNANEIERRNEERERELSIYDRMEFKDANPGIVNKPLKDAKQIKVETPIPKFPIDAHMQNHSTNDHDEV